MVSLSRKDVRGLCRVRYEGDDGTIVAKGWQPTYFNAHRPTTRTPFTAAATDAMMRDMRTIVAGCVAALVSSVVPVLADQRSRAAD
jgi:hypothetical protein